jgi:hypothetical protein
MADSGAQASSTTTHLSLMQSRIRLCLTLLREAALTPLCRPLGRTILFLEGPDQAV